MLKIRGSSAKDEGALLSSVVNELKLTLITACRNSVHVIKDNLMSVKGQQVCPELEHLFQDGNSHDGTMDLLKEYQRSANYNVSIQSKTDEGFYDALNSGLQRVSGDIVGILNSDDWLANYTVLREVVDLFEKNPDIMVVYGDLNYVKYIESERAKDKRDGFKVVRR